MPTSILMPSLSPTMEEGVLAKWLVKEGDYIKPGTMICSVETDKTTVDYETLDEGFLRKIVVQAGSQAKVNQLIAIFSEDKDEDITEFLKKEMEKSEKILAKSVTTSAAGFGSAQPAEQPAASPVIAQPVNPVVRPLSEVEGGDGRIKSSPLARKIAAEAGISLTGVQGSGPQGRIVKRDVEESKSKPGLTEGTQALFGSATTALPTQDIPLSMMRKAIGKRLLESSQNIPVFFVTQKIEVDALAKLRSDLHRGPGYKVSVNDILVKAAAFALRRHPVVNSSLMGEFIRQHGNIDIGIAVSLEGGLITPIVKDADKKSLPAIISLEIKALVAKAKAGKLAPEEYMGGTFTLSNLGMYGVDQFTAIINPPQAAILAVGGIQSEVYLDASGTPKQRDVLKVTLSSDHRVIDGAQAAQFLSTLKSVLEHPVWLML